MYIFHENSKVVSFDVWTVVVVWIHNMWIKFLDIYGHFDQGQSSLSPNSFERETALDVHVKWFTKS